MVSIRRRLWETTAPLEEISRETRISLQTLVDMAHPTADDKELPAEPLARLEAFFARPKHAAAKLRSSKALAGDILEYLYFLARPAPTSEILDAISSRTGCEENAIRARLTQFVKAGYCSRWTVRTPSRKGPGENWFYLGQRDGPLTPDVLLGHLREHPEGLRPEEVGKLLGCNAQQTVVLLRFCERMGWVRHTGAIARNYRRVKRWTVVDVLPER